MTAEALSEPPKADAQILPLTEAEDAESQPGANSAELFDSKMSNDVRRKDEFEVSRVAAACWFPTSASA
jgi:hypothetical protein